MFTTNQYFNKGFIKGKIGLFFSIILVVVSSCKKDDKDSNVPKGIGSKTIILDCAEIIADKTLAPVEGADVDYVIPCELEVTKGILTIEPGVTIAFEQDAAIIATEDGALKAIGTVEKPITFTGKAKEKGAWMGIFFHSNNVANEISNAIVEYAGGKVETWMKDKAGVAIGATWSASSTDRAKITNTTIRESEGYGLVINAGVTISNFANNKFINNGEAGVKLSLSKLGVLDKLSEYGTGNVGQHILIRIGAQEDYVAEAQTWKKLSVPYLFEKDPDRDVYEGVISSNVTVEPGVICLFTSGTALVVGEDDDESASLKAVGTSSDKIIFKGAQEGQGAWIGLNFNTNSNTNILDYVEVIGGGSENPPLSDNNFKGNIVLGNYSAAGKLTVSNTLIKNSGAYGVYKKATSQFVNNGQVTFVDNASGDIGTP